MYLRAGADRMIRLSQLVGVFDLDGRITTADTADFLRRAERSGDTDLAGADLPKSFLLLAPPKKRRGRSADASVLFSPLSAAILAQRISLL